MLPLSFVSLASTRAKPANSGPAALAALCRHEVDRLREAAAGLDVRLEIAPDVPANVSVSPDAVREALSNLLDNARRHAVGSVGINVTRADRTVQISVCDDGPGLPPGTENHAFERFVSLDGRGRGLGLPIARALAESQRGSLAYRSGAFVLTVPVGRSGASPEAPQRRA